MGAVFLKKKSQWYLKRSEASEMGAARRTSVCGACAEQRIVSKKNRVDAVASGGVGVEWTKGWMGIKWTPACNSLSGT